MSTLKDKAEAILFEKEEKIVPENIKKGIQIFGIIGTYEGSGDNNNSEPQELQEPQEPQEQEEIPEGYQLFTVDKHLYSTSNDILLDDLSQTNIFSGYNLYLLQRENGTTSVLQGDNALTIFNNKILETNLLNNCKYELNSNNTGWQMIYSNLDTENNTIKLIANYSMIIITVTSNCIEYIKTTYNLDVISLNIGYNSDNSNYKRMATNHQISINNLSEADSVVDYWGIYPNMDGTLVIEANVPYITIDYSDSRMDNGTSKIHEVTIDYKVE